MKGYYALNAAWCETHVPAGVPKDEIYSNLFGGPKTPPVCVACHVRITPQQYPLCGICGRRRAMLMSHDQPVDSNTPNRCEDCELAA